MTRDPDTTARQLVRNVRDNAAVRTNNEADKVLGRARSASRNAGAHGSLLRATRCFRALICTQGSYQSSGPSLFVSGRRSVTGCIRKWHHAFHRAVFGSSFDRIAVFITFDGFHQIFRFDPAKNYPGGIFKQRGEVLEELGGREYHKIFEMGTSSAHYTLQLAAKFPNAEITGCDLGLPMLEQAQRVANERGLKWRLIQASAEATGLPSESFDLVTSYIILHEIPAAATREIFAEAFRLLEPGGTMLMTDIRPFRDLNKVEEWRAMYLALNGGEPYWREAASLDLAEVAADIGFVDTKSYGLGERHYPWVTLGTKP